LPAKAHITNVSVWDTNTGERREGINVEFSGLDFGGHRLVIAVYVHNVGDETDYTFFRIPEANVEKHWLHHDPCSEWWSGPTVTAPREGFSYTVIAGHGRYDPVIDEAIRLEWDSATKTLKIYEVAPPEVVPPAEVPPPPEAPPPPPPEAPPPAEVPPPQIMIELADYTFPDSAVVGKEEPIRLVAHNVGEVDLLSFAGIVNLSGNPGDIIVAWEDHPPVTVPPAERAQRIEMFYVCEPIEFLGKVRFTATGNYRIRLDAGYIHDGDLVPTDYIELDVHVSELAPPPPPPEVPVLWPKILVAGALVGTAVVVGSKLIRRARRPAPA